MNLHLRDCRDMLFGDESRFCIDHADGRFRVYRRTGKKFANACVMERGRWGKAYVIVWGASHMLGERSLLF